MAVWGLLGGELVMVRRVRAFAVANEMGRGSVPAVVAAAFVSSLTATVGDPADLDIIRTSKIRGGELTTSYQ